MTEFLAPAQQSLSVATILVVDDDQETRILLSSVLGDGLGHTLVFAKDGEAGIRIFRRTDPDLVITDLVMPRLHGVLMIEHLKAVGHGLVIFGEHKNKIHAYPLFTRKGLFYEAKPGPSPKRVQGIL